MLKINSHLASMPAGYLFAEIAARVKKFESEHPDVSLLRLGIGDVTKPLVPAVVEEMKKATEEMGTPKGFHGYGPDFGYDFLIHAILENDYEARGLHISPAELFISDGSKCDVGNIQELFSADCRIAVTDPVYPVYVDSNVMAGRAGKYVNGAWDRLVYLSTNAENNFVPAMPKEHVDVIYLCYPNNPTGTVLTKAQLKMFVDYARENGSVIIYDAAYKAFITQEDVPHSIYEIEGADEVAIECCSFSKTAGFTGVRCAYMVVPEKLMGEDENGSKVSLNKMWKRRTATKFNGVSYPVQRAAMAVYSKEGMAQTKKVIEGYLENARIIREGLEQCGLTVYGGKNAPYIWLKTPNNMPSWEFFDFLLNKAHVIGTPGAGFGPCGEGYFRLTAFNTKENTIAAVKRVQDALASL